MNAPARKGKPPHLWVSSVPTGQHGRGFRDVTGSVWCGHTALRFLHQQLWMFRCPQGHEFRTNRNELERKHNAGKSHGCPVCRKEQNHG